MSLGQRIHALRNEGFSYRQIEERLGCSKGTVSYHCGDGQKQKFAKRQKLNRVGKSWTHRVSRFTEKKKTFDRDTSLKKRQSLFTTKQLLERLGEAPRCYLTGTPIDLDDTKSYALDHRVPKSRGGDNSLENCEIALREANSAKGDLLLTEFLDLCEKVLQHHGYSVVRPS